MRKLIPVLALLILLASGCKSPFQNPFGRGETPKTQTLGGSVSVVYEIESGQVEIETIQPSNPDQPATIEFEVIPYDYTTVGIPDEAKQKKSGFRIIATTGSSREDQFAGLGLKLDQYKAFSYVGAAMCLIGVGVFVASFYFPLIPKLAGLIVFLGGGLTAYLATAIPEYGHYALGVCVIGFVAWYYYRTAGKKHPDEFKKKKNT